MFAFCWLRVWIVSLLPTDRFKTIVEQFREFERFVPVPFEQLFTYPGRIALTYDELIVVMCMAMWAIARGSDCVAGELCAGPWRWCWRSRSVARESCSHKPWSPRWGRPFCRSRPGVGCMPVSIRRTSTSR